jgi:nucleoside triphosphatase
MDPGETIEEALRREIREELGPGLEIGRIAPWSFRDDVRVKTYAGGSTEEIYMIYLIFDCEALNREIALNEEFDGHAWVRPADLGGYALNEATRLTFTLKGLL